MMYRLKKSLHRLKQAPVKTQHKIFVAIINQYIKKTQGFSPIKEATIASTTRNVVHMYWSSLGNKASEKEEIMISSLSNKKSEKEEIMIYQIRGTDMGMHRATFITQIQIIPFVSVVKMYIYLIKC